MRHDKRYDSNSLLLNMYIATYTQRLYTVSRVLEYKAVVANWFDRQPGGVGRSPQYEKMHYNVYVQCIPRGYATYRGPLCTYLVTNVQFSSHTPCTVFKSLSLKFLLHLISHNVFFLTFCMYAFLSIKKSILFVWSCRFLASAASCVD
jgi:hypothetical protein